MRRIAAGALLAGALAMGPTFAIRAGDQGSLPGEATYQALCARCHGGDARGVPGVGPDLTHLTEHYGRPLSRPGMIDEIAGHGPLQAEWSHRSRVCGSKLLPGAGPAFSVMRRGLILQVLEHLDRRQQPVPDPSASARSRG